jgi:hypothetical protein
LGFGITFGAELGATAVDLDPAVEDQRKGGCDNFYENGIGVGWCYASDLKFDVLQLDRSCDLNN